MERYNLDPSRCIQCSTSLDYKHRHNKFCTKSCAAIYNNMKRPPGSESRRSQQEKLSGRKIDKTRQRSLPTHKMSKIEWHSCICCQKIFYTKTWSSSRRTCGAPECLIHSKVGNRPYKNGRRKIFRYPNHWNGTVVLLESSWELTMAEWLDSNGIRWSRPSPIKWTDKTGRQRLYYPDFYLTELGVYLDPKNPTAERLEMEKMIAVSTVIPLIHGNLDHIKEKVALLRNAL